MAASRHTIIVIRWIARLLATALFFLWGAFFVEHLAWFKPGEPLPPVHVFVRVALHGFLLLSYIAAWRFERVGGIAIIVFACAFFLGLSRSTDMVGFAMGAALPGVLFLICRGRER